MMKNLKLHKITKGSIKIYMTHILLELKEEKLKSIEVL